MNTRGQDNRLANDEYGKQVQVNRMDAPFDDQIASYTR
jgi:hypothetical protein